MLKRAEARDGVERAEAFPIDLTGVLEVDLKSVPAASSQLRRGQRHPHAGPAARPGVGEQRPPAATEIEQASPWPDPDLFGHVLVLAPLRRLEAERKVTVKLGAAEIGQLPQAEADDPIRQRVGEVGVPSVRHRRPNIRPPARGLERTSTRTVARVPIPDQAEAD